MKKGARVGRSLPAMAPPPPLSVLLLVLVLVVAAEEGALAAAACDAKRLAACVPALTTGVTPNAECCSNLRAQLGCLCQFAKNPAFKRYVGKPNTRGTITACGISRPRCT